MRRNPLFIFPNKDSQGVYNVPLKSTIHIVDIDNIGTPMFLQLVAKNNLSPTSTIEDLLQYPENYINLFTVGEVYSELELLTEGGNIGWRILNRNPNHYGYIGEGAFDFSYNNTNSDHKGAIGDYSFSTGKYTSAWGLNSFVTGIGTVSGYDNQSVFGSYNRNNATNIFEVGIGTDPTLAGQQNAIEITKDGVIIAPSMEVSDIQNQRTLITKEYLENLSGEGGQLLAITENGNSGWRLAGRNIENYNDIGSKAIDLSWSTMQGDYNGASGDTSFAVGLNVIARAPTGTALGRYNDDQDDTILEVGNGSGSVVDPRSNALEVYMDGRVRAPSLELINIDHAKSLITQEYIQTLKIQNLNYNIDVVDATVKVYGIPIPNDTLYDLTTIEIFNNGILLRENRDYTINIVATGIELSFSGLNYTLHIGDWLKIKIPTIKY